MTRALALLAVALAAAVAAIGAAAPSPARTATLIAAGDIASCSSGADEETAKLVAARRGTVATLGDNVYDSGTTREFADCYRPSWGRFKARTRPAPGNHDFETPGASGYFGYFGRAAGAAPTGWYTYRLGEWRIIVLNSNCGSIGGCHAGSPQERWLRATLRSNRSARCTLAYWHHPRFSSGQHGGSSEVGAFWSALYQHGADVVLSGHDHTYERFAPQNPDGKLDRRRGIRQFVVGTGGRSLYRFEEKLPTTQSRQNHTYGVLVLTLRSGGYSWRFVPQAGKTFSDRGSGTCH